jgi:hypothetical protein
MPEKIKNNYLSAVRGLTIKIVNNHNDWYNHVMNLPQNQQIVYTVLILDNQVKQEGFMSYFKSSFGMFALKTIAHLEKIGCTNRSKMLKLALEHTKNNSNEDVINLDKEYRNLNDENVDKFLKIYLATHP